MKLKLVGTGAITGKERSACSLIDEKIFINLRKRPKYIVQKELKK